MLLMPVSGSRALKMKCEWMFHSKQLVLDAAVLLTEVETCLPAQQWCAGLLCYSVTAAAHTRCPCQRLTRQLVFCSS